jgi:hypothetical protein
MSPTPRSRTATWLTKSFQVSTASTSPRALAAFSQGVGVGVEDAPVVAAPVRRSERIVCIRSPRMLKLRAPRWLGAWVRKAGSSTLLARMSLRMSSTVRSWRLPLRST